MATILIVDDQPAMLELARHLVQAAGHAAVPAAGAAAAIEAFRQQSCDLVLTDLVMPDQSGLDLLRQLRRIAPVTPVVIMTGKASLDAAVACLKSGAADFLTKPLDPAKLAAVLDACLAARQQAAGTLVLPTHPGLRTIAGYEIKRTLGAGTCGVVYLAERVVAGQPRRVALKVLRDDVAPEVRERFTREAEVVARLDHPNIVRLWDFDVRASAPVPYLAMEYVPGLTLKQEEARGARQWDRRRQVSVLRQLAAALEVIHAAGLCHRDLKPHNVLLTGANGVKLTDFGIVRTLGSELTAAGMLLGTPAYMAPEGFCHAGLDGRADLFALGVLAYELCLGVLPFAAPTLPALVYAVGTEPPAAPRRLAPDLPVELERILAGLLRKDREERYATAGAVRADLDAVLAGQPLPHARADWPTPTWT